nr:hypothetical protein [Tanacetum cinerariifolium]
MVRLWRLWWPQLARTSPQRWRQAAEYNEAPLGVAPLQPNTTCYGSGGYTIVRPPPGWWQYPKVSRCFMGCSAVIVADPPPTAHHDGGSDWKSRRCCGGHDSGVGGWWGKVE